MNKSILFLFCIWITGTFAMAQTIDKNYVDGAVYVKFKNNVSILKSGESRIISSSLLFPALKSSEMGKYKIRETAYSMHLGNNKELSNCFQVEIENYEAIDSFIEELQQGSDVEYVEKVPMGYIAGSVPNDPFYGELGQHQLNWHLKMLGFEDVYGKYAADPALKVAVTDNAIWGGHPDLQILPENQYNAVTHVVGNSSPVGVAVDENCLSVNSCTSYVWSHGTHAAGLIGAITNNGQGIASFASGVTLLAAKISASSSPMAVPYGYQGITWAIDKGAKIINASWTTIYAKAQEEIIKEAVNRGIIIVAAAGNDSAKVKKYPAAYDNVVSVGSVDSDKRRSIFSNYGEWVRIAAPGGYHISGNGVKNSLFSTTYCVNKLYALEGYLDFNGIRYDGMSGTSMAAPVATSVIALMVSLKPDLDAPTILKILQETATPVEGEFEMAESSGIINPVEALKAVEKLNSGIKSTQEDASVTIYPNPVKDMLNIKSNFPLKQIKISDTTGRIITSINNHPFDHIDFSSFPKGAYLLQINNIHQIIIKN